MFVSPLSSSLNCLYPFFCGISTFHVKLHEVYFWILYIIPSSILDIVNIVSCSIFIQLAYTHYNRSKQQSNVSRSYCFFLNIYAKIGHFLLDVEYLAYYTKSGTKYITYTIRILNILMWIISTITFRGRQEFPYIGICALEDSVLLLFQLNPSLVWVVHVRKLHAESEPEYPSRPHSEYLWSLCFLSKLSHAHFQGLSRSLLWTTLKSYRWGHIYFWGLAT